MTGGPKDPLEGEEAYRQRSAICDSGFEDVQGRRREVAEVHKTHVLRLMKMDMVAVLIELERQEEVALTIKLFIVIQKQDWYKPDVYLYKDLIIALARCKKMDDVMGLWESMREDNLFPDSQTCAELIRGFLSSGSPGDAMNVYEDMKKSPDPPEELPFRILLKGLLSYPLLRNRVKQDFEELFPEKHMYDPPEEIFGVR